MSGVEGAPSPEDGKPLAGPPAPSDEALRSAAVIKLQRKIRSFLDARRVQQKQCARGAGRRTTRAAAAFRPRPLTPRARAGERVAAWYRSQRAAGLRAAPAPPLSAVTRARVLLLVLVWYCLALLLSLFNKHMLGRTKGAFPAPLLMTSFQFGVQGAVIAFLLDGPYRDLAAPPMEWGVWARSVLPLGCVGGGDIGLSNASLVYVSLSFYTMVKSSSVMFLLLFAIAMGLERPSYPLAGSVALICGGVICTVAAETSFDGLGLALVLVAAALSGLRWTLSQRLMRVQPGHAHPLPLLGSLMPAQAVACLLAALLHDDLRGLKGSAFFATPWDSAMTLLKVVSSGCLALCMGLAEFTLLRATGAVTIGVAGTVKEAVSVAVFALVDGDPLGPVNAVGLLLVVAGVGAYNAARAAAERQRREGATREAQQGGGGEEGRDGGGDQLEVLGGGGDWAPGTEPARRAPPAPAPGTGAAAAAHGHGHGHGRGAPPPGPSYTEAVNALLPNKAR